MAKTGVSNERAMVVFGFVLLLLAYHLVFGRFFPNAQGGLGHDYAFQLPALLDGYFWYRNNGFGTPPWFTPSFCGGLPGFPDPQSQYYSVPQLLTAFVDPLHSLYLTVLLFAAAGFWGCYLLLRGTFQASRGASFLAAALFMFNGFFSHRMIIGHTTFHAFMLTPWIAWLLLGGPQAPLNRYRGLVLPGLAAGALAAYCFLSGMTVMLPMIPVMVLAIACLAQLQAPRPLVPFIARSEVAALAATGLVMSKLVAAALLLHNFSRSDYILPQLANPFDALVLFIQTLFLSPSGIAQQWSQAWINPEWEIGRWEYEYGVSFVPLFILLAGGGYALLQAVRHRPVGRFPVRKLVALAGLVALLALPLALNVYSPQWNTVLKELPFFRSSSNLLRWFAIYIPVVVVGCALVVDRLQRQRPGVAAFPVIAILVCAAVASHALVNRQTYQERKEAGFKPDTLLQAYREVAGGRREPAIHAIGAGNPNVLAQGQSPLPCIAPIFGYQGESLPLKQLRRGPALASVDGVLNVKNPACYVYPDDNGCEPGDHFREDQRSMAEQFLTYRPFPFRVPLLQSVANQVSLATLIAIVLCFLVAAATTLARRCRRHD